MADESQCDWYLGCLATQKQCVNSNFEYAIQFGYYFCSKYQQEVENGAFTWLGTQWVDQVKSCLQLELISELWTEAQSTKSIATVDCESIQNIAFDSHSDCYTAQSSHSTAILALRFCVK